MTICRIPLLFYFLFLVNTKNGEPISFYQKSTIKFRAMTNKIESKRNADSNLILTVGLAFRFHFNDVDFVQFFNKLFILHRMNLLSTHESIFSYHKLLYYKTLVFFFFFHDVSGWKICEYFEKNWTLPLSKCLKNKIQYFSEVTMNEYHKTKKQSPRKQNNLVEIIFFVVVFFDRMFRSTG